MTHRNSILQRHAAVVLTVAAAAAALGVPGAGPPLARAGEECDAQCWAILQYLSEQGLTSEEIEDLGASDIQPDRPAPPVTTTTLRPATTTAPPALPESTNISGSVRPATTTIPPPDDGECDPTTTWACDEVNAGIDDGYLPDGFNPHTAADPDQLLEIIEAFGDQNPHFDAQAALLALENVGEEADRGEMFNAIAAGLGIPYDPDDNGGDVADELGDLGIVWGHDGDPTSNPHSDADPDSTLSNAALAALLDRIQDTTGGDPTGPVVGLPTPADPAGGRPSTPGTDEACSTDLVLTPSEVLRFAAQLRWETLVRIEARGEPGEPWPPHPDVPGGAEFLVVSKSPVWPVVDPGARWEAQNPADGCVWVASHVETQVSQMLPWRSGHRRVLEHAGTFGVYLSRWDSLSPGQQAQAVQRHRNGDVDARCPLEAATVSEDAYAQCRWELPESGVWSWKARACFEADTGQAVHRDCETLTQGTEWFVGIIDYTSGITVRADPGDHPRRGPRRPPRVG